MKEQLIDKKEELNLFNPFKKTFIVILLGLIFLVFGVFLSISLGAQEISFFVILSNLFSATDDITGKIIHDVRIPRAISALLVGGFLSVAGAAVQGVTRNPITEPSILGVTQGATLMIALMLVIQKIIPSLLISGKTRMGFAFLGAGISGLFVYFISSRKKAINSPIKLVLAGTAMGTLFISLAIGIAIYFNLSQELGFWIAGGLVNSNWESVKLLCVFGGFALFLILFLSPKITLLSLGDEVAVGLGENIHHIRLITILGVVLLTGSSVAVGGNIIFVGLIIPQILRSILGSDYRRIIPSSMIWGGVLLVFSDIFARMINAPYETPLGSFTALLGVPIFIYLVRKDNQ